MGHCIIDVHDLYRICEELREGFGNDFLETLKMTFRHPSSVQYGRTVPLLFPYLFVFFRISDLHDANQHLFNLALWLILVNVAFTFVKRLTSARLAPLFVGLLIPAFWPTTGALYRPHLQEQPLVVCIVLSLLIIHCGESKRNILHYHRLKILGTAVGSTFFLWLALGLKETGVIIFFPLLFIHVSALYKPSHIRNVHYYLMPITLASILLYTGLLSLTPFSEGSYTKDYNMTDFQLLFERALQWREMVAGGYGPLLYIILISFALRLILEIYNGHLSNKMRWRFSLLVMSAAGFAIIMPWDKQGILVGRLLIPAAVAFHIVAACELGELWALLRSSSRSPVYLNCQEKLSVFVLAIILIMLVIFPIITVPLNWNLVGLKAVFIFLAVLVGSVVFKSEYKNYVNYCVFSKMFKHVGTVFVVASSIYFCGVSLVMAYTVYHQSSLYMVKYHEPVFDLLAQKVPENSKIYINSRAYWVHEINYHFQQCILRDDIEVIPVSIDHYLPRPSDIFVSLPMDPAFDMESLSKYFSSDTHEQICFYKSRRWFNGIFFQPGRISLWLLGLSSEQNMPKPADYFQFHGIWRTSEQCSVVFFPKSF